MNVLVAGWSLGLKDLYSCNEALLSKHVWNLATKKDSLWVKWIHTVKLRGKNFWEVDADINDSWGSKNILKVRDKVRDIIVYKIGNGRSISMWYENWSQIGPLNQYITHRDLYDARLDVDLRVSDMIKNGSWNWPTEWYSKFNIVTNISVPIINPEKSDGVVWTSTGNVMDFAVKNVYRELRSNDPSVTWWKLVWYSQCIPKHAFILWLAINNRLSTQDRIQKWGNCAVNRCYLCKKEIEDLEHLFFKCEFSRGVWNKKKIMANIQKDMGNWHDIIHELTKGHNGNNIWSVVKRLILAARVSCIRNERNCIIFKDESKSQEEVANRVIEIVKMKLLSLKVKDSITVRNVERIWSIVCNKKVKPV